MIVDWLTRPQKFLCSGATIGALVLSGAFGTASASAETINGALTKAYNNNPTLNAQRAATRSAHESVAIAKSGYRPTITADANIGLTETDSHTPFGRVKNSLKPYGFGVSINQTLWDSFLTFNNVEAAYAAVSASQESLRNAEQNILFNAASAYLDVLRDRAILGYRRKNLGFLEEQVRSEQARFDVGEATRTDVAQARASRAGAQAQVSLASANVKSSEAIYVQIIGNQPSRLAPVAGVGRAAPGKLQSGMSIAMSEHPAIKAASHIARQAEYQVKAAESGLLPTVGLTGRLARSHETSSPDVTTDSSSVSATLSVPIYQAGRQSATVRQNKETLTQRQIQVDEQVDSVRAAVVSAYSQFQGAQASSVANREQLRAANLALEGVVEERKEGQRTTLDVLNTQAQVISAQIALAESDRNVKVAGYAILSAIGRLKPEVLRLGIASHDPVPHLQAVEDKWIGLRKVVVE